MDSDSKLRKSVEQMVRQEMEAMLLEATDLARELATRDLLPRLRGAIRDSIAHTMEEALSDGTMGLCPSGGEEDAARGLSNGLGWEPAGPEAGSPVPAAGDGGSATSCGGGRGLYVYCVAHSAAGCDLGATGIDSTEVRGIPFQDICAIVHDCTAEPYQSDDEAVVRRWVEAHQRVVDSAMERFHTVLPLSFDTVVRGGEDASPEAAVLDWLRDEYNELKGKIDRLRGKREYGVQVFYDPVALGEAVARGRDDIARLRREMDMQSPGTAYMLRHKLEKALKTAVEEAVQERFKDFYRTIGGHAEDVKIGKLGPGNGRVMLMNLSCLVTEDKVAELGDELEKIESIDGFSVRFTGPWAPYSFV